MATSLVLGHLNKKKSQLIAAVPRTLRAQMTWESIMQGVGLAMESNEKLGQCDPQTVYTSLLFILRLGLDPSGMTQEAYLVPFWNKNRGLMECAPMIGQMGKIELAYRSGRISKIVCNVIHDNDEFDLNLADGTITHTLDLRNPDRGDLLACYTRIWLKGVPEPTLELMTYQDFEKIKASVQRRGKLGPAYRDWESEMFRRSCLSRALKRAPKSADLMDVLAEEAKQNQRVTRGDVIDATWADPGDDARTDAKRLGMDETPNDMEQFNRDRATSEQRQTVETTTEDGPNGNEQVEPEREDIKQEIRQLIGKLEVGVVDRVFEAQGFRAGQSVSSIKAGAERLISLRDALETELGV